MRVLGHRRRGDFFLTPTQQVTTTPACSKTTYVDVYITWYKCKSGYSAYDRLLSRVLSSCFCCTLYHLRWVCSESDANSSSPSPIRSVTPLCLFFRYIQQYCAIVPQREQMVKMNKTRD